MISAFHIQRLQFFRGGHAGLAEPTARLSLRWDGHPDDWPATEAHWRQQALALCPPEVLPRPEACDWPHAWCQAPISIPSPAAQQATGRHPAAAHTVPGSTPGTPGHWVLALTCALQQWSRDALGAGRLLSEQPGGVELALPWQREATCREALNHALRLLLLWSHPAIPSETVRALHTERQAWLIRQQGGGLPPNTLRFAQAARARGIPLVQRDGLIQLGWGRHSRRLDSSFTDATGVIATRLARQKIQTSRRLAENALPVPAGAQVATLEAARQVAKQLGWPVVVKPASEDQGRGVAPDLRDEAAFEAAFATAQALSPGAVIVEKHIEGADYRLLVVGGRLRMATRRIPAGVTGDGQHSLQALVEQANADPRRGHDKRSLLLCLHLDDPEARRCLAEQALSHTSVPAAGRFVYLRKTANISTGGTAEDVTAQLHPDNRLLAERAARIIGLDIAGVDFLCPDITRSWREVGGAICEVNAQPGFRVHWLGDPQRDINGEIVDWLMQGGDGRIPTAAITGTNGKSTTARMLHHIWQASGRTCGVTTTAGTWVGEALISRDNLSGLPGARLLLDDPAVEAAVLELPRKGLLVFGHPCDAYDVAALLNVQDDHIGADGIDTLEQMAALKAEVLERARHAVVINADDPLCLAMRSRATCSRHLLVSRTAHSPALQAHLAVGGEGVFVQPHAGQPWIVLAEGARQTPLLALAAIPATLAGQLPYNEQNALFAVALAWAQGIEPATIARALAAAQPGDQVVMLVKPWVALPLIEQWQAAQAQAERRPCN